MIGELERSPRVERLAQMVGPSDPEPEHAAQVTWLAGRIFDELEAEHGLGAAERELLLAAGVAHDVGWSISGTDHHKHSARIIEEMDLPEFSPRERWIIAALARYHSGALPQEEHRVFGRLDETDRELVRLLAAILRVADGLDRTHAQVVREVTVRRGPEGLHVVVEASGGAEAELWAARKKADLWEEVYGPVVIEAQTL